MLNALDSQTGVAGRAEVCIASPLVSTLGELQDDALSRDCEAALTSIVFGLALGVQHEVCFVLPGQLDSQREFPRSDFFKVVTGLLGNGGLKLSDFLIRLGKLGNEVRLGALSVDDGLLRLDYLLIELGAQLSELRPVSGVNGALGNSQQADHGSHGALKFNEHMDAPFNGGGCVRTPLSVDCGQSTSHGK